MPRQRRLTLPKIQPPVFQGVPLAWLDWFGLFSAIIDSAAISQAEKIIHLQTLVSGEPKALIASYGCNPAMYQYALSRLKSTYHYDAKQGTFDCNRSVAVWCGFFTSITLRGFSRNEESGVK